MENEKRLINSVDLVEEIENIDWYSAGPSGMIHKGAPDSARAFYKAVEIFKAIEEAPTVDAVPVVRCKECKHCDPENYHCDHPMSTAAPLRRKPDDFCSYGERKDGDGNG